MHYKFNFMACLFGAALAGAGLASCSKGDSKAETETDEAPVVKVETVYSTDVVQKGVYTATVDADLINNISSSTPNRIREIYVDKGMTVTKGQKLVVLDDVNLVAYETQVENAKAAVANAEAGVDNASAGVNNAQANFNNVQLNYNRAVQLFNIGGGTKQNVDAMETQLITARNSLTTAKSALSSAQKSLQSAKSGLASAEKALSNARENTVLVSPISGVVTARNYDPGDMTGALPILTVAQVQPVKVVCNISETELSKVHKGMVADCTFDTYGDTNFEGTVTMISPTVDEQTRTFGIEVTLPNKENRVLPGMFGRVTLNLGVAKHVVVPDKAVVKQPGSGNQYVYVYSDGKVQYKQVELGQRINDTYEILSGLEDGEQVVVSGQSKLANGKEVRLAK